MIKYYEETVMGKTWMFLRGEGIWKAVMFAWILSECLAMFLFVADGVAHQFEPMKNPWVLLLMLPLGISIATGVVVSLAILGFRYIADAEKRVIEQMFVIKIREEARSPKYERYDRHYVYRNVERIARKMGIPVERAKELAIKEGGPYALLNENM